MNKLLDLLAEIEASVEWAVDDRKDRENIMDWIHQAMDIAVQGKAHKWPEEKPKESNSYLIMNHGGAFHTFHYFLEIEELEETEKLEEGWYAYPGYNLNEVVKYWWNLPEVTE